jgi:hypothetical protein
MYFCLIHTGETFQTLEGATEIGSAKGLHGQSGTKFIIAGQLHVLVSQEMLDNRKKLSRPGPKKKPTT